MNVQIEPTQSLVIALRPIVSGMGIKTCVLGWPDVRKFDADGKLPLLAVFPVHETGKAFVSREQIHAVVNNADGLTATVYREQQRIIYTLQFSLFCKTEEDRSNIGWTFQQHFTTLENVQIPIGIPGVEDALFRRFLGKRDSQGEPGFYQRDITFEVTARILDATTGVSVAKIIELDSSVSTTTPVTTSTTPTTPVPSSSSGGQRIING